MPECRFCGCTFVPQETEHNCSSCQPCGYCDEVLIDGACANKQCESRDLTS